MARYNFGSAKVWYNFFSFGERVTAVPPPYMRKMNPYETLIQPPKGLLDYGLLLVVSRGEVSSEALVEELSQAQLLAAEGIIYPLLHQLKTADLLDYRTEVSEAGLPKKIYSLTEEGKKALAAYANSWKALQQSLTKITKKK